MRGLYSIVGDLHLLEILCRCRETVCLGLDGRSGGGSGRGGPQAGQRFAARRAGGLDLAGCRVTRINFGHAQIPTVPLAVQVRSLLDVPVNTAWDPHYAAQPVPLPIAIQIRSFSGPRGSWRLPVSPAGRLGSPAGLWFILKRILGVARCAFRTSLTSGDLPVHVGLAAVALAWRQKSPAAAAGPPAGQSETGLRRRFPLA